MTIMSANRRHAACTRRYQQSRKMEKKAHEILTIELAEEVESISQIMDLGSVNNVYDVKCKGGNYVVRINRDENKEFEF